MFIYDLTLFMFELTFFFFFSISWFHCLFTFSCPSQTQTDKLKFCRWFLSMNEWRITICWAIHKCCFLSPSRNYEVLLKLHNNLAIQFTFYLIKNQADLLFLFQIINTALKGWSIIYNKPKSLNRYYENLFLICCNNLAQSWSIWKMSFSSRFRSFLMRHKRKPTIRQSLIKDLLICSSGINEWNCPKANEDKIRRKKKKWQCYWDSRNFTTKMKKNWKWRSWKYDDVINH